MHMLASGILTLAQAAPPRTIQSLFLESFDAFTVLLLLGSIVAVAVIARCILEIRPEALTPAEPERRLRQHMLMGEHDKAREYAATEPGISCMACKAATAGLERTGGDERAARESAELVASEECSRWFRKLEPLQIVGNLGPLLGLAGTVWGMILAFSSLSTTGGQASPVLLSAGIAKALFHTLLGLLLAVPALTFYGFYRQRLDRLCTRSLIISGELVDMTIAAWKKERAGAVSGGDAGAEHERTNGVARAAATSSAA
ncbi:hypothetical protein BH11PLA1_BH11PLA1_05970 [soil metagenome]